MKKISKQGIETYRRLLVATKKYWPMVLFGILGTIALSLIDALFAWLIKPIINKGFIARDMIFIHWLPLIVVMIFIFRGIASFSSSYFVSRVSRNVVMDFRRYIFSHLLKLPAHFYDRNSSGHLLSTIIYNVEQVAQASSDALVITLQEATLVIGLVAVMFIISWQLTLLFMIVVPVIVWVMKVGSRRLRRLSGSVQKSVGEVTHIASEGIDGYKVIRLYGGQRYENDKFEKVTKTNQQREIKVVITNSVSTSLVQLLISIPIAFILFFAAQPTLHVSAGSFASIISSMIMLLRPVRRLTMINSYIQKGIAGAESIFKLLDEPIEKDSGIKKISRVKGAISYRQVSFCYPGNETPVLQDINFEIEPGKTVAIVGRSGAGKSTLIHLLPRFYESTNGSIEIDQIDIRDFHLQDLRHQFALVSQQTVLFNDTIANNIAYGHSNEIDSSRILAAATAAYAMEFIDALPEGLNTIIGEDGVLLSGGQRQRIAIARALYKDAPILILDEATSSLDTHSEQHIQMALQHLMKTRTTLVIAHRLSTIENADWIIVLDKGSIVETGTHRELLALNGVYTKLHRLQFRETLAVEEI